MTLMQEPTFLILTALAVEPTHGYGVIRAVDALSQGDVVLRPGTLYGALERLAEQGLVEVDREEAVDGRLRRYYRLTDTGAAALATRSRGELGFAVFGSLVALAVVFEAALYAANGADRIQERYFFAILPLIGLLFALYVRRGFPHRVHHALIAGAALALSARVPLAGFSAADGKSNSPLLLAVGIFEQKVGDVGLASLLVAIIVAGLSIVAAATGWDMTGKPPVRLRPATLHRFSLARGGALALVESNVPLLPGVSASRPAPPASAPSKAPP